MNPNEENCLSALMKSASDVYFAIGQGLAEEHFANPTSRLLYVAILKAASDTKDSSPHCVWQQLVSLEGKSPIPITELLRIDALQPTAINLSKLVSSLLDAKRVATLGLAIDGAANALKTQATAFDEVWENVAPFIEQAQNSVSKVTSRTLAEICEVAAMQIEQPETRKTVGSGFASVDRLFTPMRAGQLIVLAARPGAGKSALAAQIAHHAAKSGERVAFFSLEMSGEELAERLGLVRAGRDALLHTKSLTGQIRELGKLNKFHIFDNSQRHTMAGIAAKCRLLSLQKPSLGLVVIDYLQLITPADRKQPREQQVAEISRALKELAGSLKVPVIALAQLNRESEKEERRPRLSDLRESGSLEQDADRVWFLWSDSSKASIGEDQDAIDILLIQSKCRGGPPNVAKSMRFDRPIYTFTPIQAPNHNE